jgi:hypothetical protein
MVISSLFKMEKYYHCTMKRYSQRKIPFLTVLMLCGIVGIFFCIKAFFPAVFSQEPLPNRSTQSFSQLAASFTSAKT